MGQTHGFQGVVDPGLDLRRVNPSDLQAISDIFINRGVEDAGAREHQGNAPPQVQAIFQDAAIIPVVDFTLVGPLQEGQDAEKGGLAAPVGALQDIGAAPGRRRKSNPGE